MKTNLITEAARLQKLAGIKLAEDFKDDVEDIKKAPLATAVDKIRDLIKDPEFKDKIKAGELDGATSDETISFGSGNVKCTKMFPTQAEIGFDNSLADICNDKYGAIDSAFSNPVLMPADPKKIPILTAKIGSDIAILDGHHRWSLCFMINPDAEMECDIMETPSGYTAEDALKIMQLAIGAEAGKVVTKPFNGKDLMAVSTNEVIKYITENIGEKEIATFAKYRKELNSKEAIASHVGEAHKKIIKMKGPFPRTIMPQAGDSGTTQVAVNNAFQWGAGGALAYANNITVAPGNSYTVVVGAVGVSFGGANGGGSSFNSTSCKAGGGATATAIGTAAAGGVVIYGTGGSGGAGGTVTASSFTRAGGGGAGGYSGSGGTGGNAGNAGTSGAGGGGGGGGGHPPGTNAGAGGGTGIFGEGSSGSGGAAGVGGNGGSGGTVGGSLSGGDYGGGGAGATFGTSGGGAVRIIWAGTTSITRAFPSTNTGDI
jgi:hypothetical protein